MRVIEPETSNETSAAKPAARPRRRWFQYSIRSLLLLILVVSIPCSWYAYHRYKVLKAARAVERLQELGCVLSVIHGQDWDDWTCYGALIGDEWKGTDADLALLGDLPDLKELYLDNPNIAEAGLAHLRRLRGLEALHVSSHRVTDATLHHLARLMELETLELTGPITDEGLDALRGLKKLRELKLSETRTSQKRIGRLLVELPGLKSVTHRALTWRQWPSVIGSLGEDTLAEFIQCPLSDVVTYLEDYHDIEIRFDPAAQDRRDAPITVDMRAPLEKVLVSILDPLDLEAVVQPPELLITSEQEAARLAPQRQRVTWRRLPSGRIDGDRGLRIVLPEAATAGR
jgi:hypothetical protein